MGFMEGNSELSWEEARTAVDPAHQDFRDRYGLEHGGINLLTGESIMENTRLALRKAMQLVADQTSVQKVLLINTSTGSRRTLKYARELDPQGLIGDQMSKPVTIMSSVTGELCKHYEHLLELIDRHGFTTIVITSWEFASENSRYRDKLLFQLRRLCEELGITVLVYSDRPNMSWRDAGCTTRGKIGKLSAVADVIMSAMADQSLRRELPEQNEEHSEEFVGHDGKLSIEFAPTKQEVAAEEPLEELVQAELEEEVYV